MLKIFVDKRLMKSTQCGNTGSLAQLINRRVEEFETWRRVGYAGTFSLANGLPIDRQKPRIQVPCAAINPMFIFF